MIVSQFVKIIQSVTGGVTGLRKVENTGEYNVIETGKKLNKSDQKVNRYMQVHGKLKQIWTTEMTMISSH